MLGAALVVAITGGVGWAGPASAAGASAGSAPCSSMLTVVPTEIFWAPGHVGPWWEGGSVTEVGSCIPGATGPVIATGSWQRVGAARASLTGECPPASFSLQDTRTGAWTNYYEMTNESATETSQLIGIDPIYTPGIPVGTDSFSTRIPTGGVTLARTDPVACNAWPTVDEPPPPPDYTLPAPPSFHIEFDR